MAKKILLLVSAVVLIAAIGIGSTLASITTATTGINVVTLGNVKIKVSHRQEEAEKVSLIPNVWVDFNRITIENAGSRDAFLRVKLGSPTLSDVEMAVKEDSNWKIYKDYAYYKHPVSPNQLVSFVGQIKLPAQVEKQNQHNASTDSYQVTKDSLPQGFQMDVQAESLQAEHIGCHTSGPLKGYPQWPDATSDF